MFKRLLAFGLVATVFAVIVLPLVLYWIGLHGVDGRPDKPAVLVSTQRQIFVWHKAKGQGVPLVTSLTPYSYALAFLSGNPDSMGPGGLVAWWVASDYLLEHKRFQGMGWWHLSGVALTIWVSRNWSTEEMLSHASESFDRRVLTDD